MKVKGRNVKKVLLFALLLCPCVACAQFFNVDYDKKIISTDSLNLPGNSTARNVLDLLPELLQRPGSSTLSTYDIKINDMSLGASQDAVLMQLNLYELEKIEISESPTSSYKNNGQGGSINLILRDKSQIENTKHTNLYGSLSMQAEYPLDVTPQFTLGYNKDRFTLHAFAVGEWYDYDKNQTKSTSVDNDDRSILEKFYSQMARVYTKYNTGKDCFKFNLSEASTSDRNTTTQIPSAVQILDDKTSSTTLQTLFNYRHTFGQHLSLETEAQYIYNPSNQNNLDPELCSYQEHTRRHNVSGKIEFKAPLVHDLKFADPNNRHFADIIVGVNVNGEFLNKDIVNNRYKEPKGTVYDYPTDKSFFLMPYAQIEAGLGKFRFKAIGEFQHYEYHINMSNNSYAHNADDFTGKLMLEWHFTKEHQFRLIFDRQIIRPTDNQIFPFMRYNPSYMFYSQGVNLPPSGVQEVKVDYVGFIKFTRHQNLMLNASVSYNNVSNIIDTIFVKPSSGSGGLGYSQQYYTFRNNGDNKLVNANLMARYSYRYFSCTFTGNLTHLYTSNGIESDEYTSYNMSIYPSIVFPHGWSAAFHAVYYSRIFKGGGRVGDYGTMRLSVGKDFGPLNVTVFGSVVPGGRINDFTYPAGVTTITSSTSYYNCVGATLHWSF